MKVYKVGGAVRDQLMGRTPKDIDWVVVGSTPEEMTGLGFQQVGISFPVFLHPETGDEWALARTEQKSGVGYNGFSVSTEGVTIESDLGRRDFSINSIAFDCTTGRYIDPFNGMEDLDNKILRHTSTAFSEDPLRVIRLARFYARYTDFTVANETMQLAKNIVDSGEMNSLPNERFVLEFEKVANDSGSDFGRFVELLFKLGVFSKVDFFKSVFWDDRFVKVFYFGVDPMKIFEVGKYAKAIKQSGLEPGEILVAALHGIVPTPDKMAAFGNNAKNIFSSFDACYISGITWSEVTAEHIVDVLFKTRSTKVVSQHFKSALKIIDALWSVCEWKFIFSAKEWEKFASVTANLDIIPLVQKYSGKELGEQIRLAMIAEIEKEMK